jgi:hypothetical protein
MRGTAVGCDNKLPGFRVIGNAPDPVRPAVSDMTLVIRLQSRCFDFSKDMPQASGGCKEYKDIGHEPERETLK